MIAHALAQLLNAVGSPYVAYMSPDIGYLAATCGVESRWEDGLSASTPAGALMTGFSQTELRTFRALRDRYQRDRDLLDAQELARLCFVRWLYRSGRLVA